MAVTRGAFIRDAQEIINHDNDSSATMRHIARRSSRWRSANMLQHAMRALQKVRRCSEKRKERGDKEAKQCSAPRR
jgi:hypothetical protein